MYNYSGLYHNLFTDLFVLTIILIIILLQKPWKWKHKRKSSKKESDTKQKKSDIIIFVILSLFMIIHTSIDVYRIICPKISSYTGQFVESHHTIRGKTLRYTYHYTFWNGEGKKQVYQLDRFSRNKIFPSNELEVGKEYTVYYDDFTDIIVGIEISEDSTEDGSLS